MMKLFLSRSLGVPQEKLESREKTALAREVFAGTRLINAEACTGACAGDNDFYCMLVKFN